MPKIFIFAEQRTLSRTKCEASTCLPSCAEYNHQLPTKTDEVVFCPLTPIQVAVYKRILNMNHVQNLVRKDEDCDCGSGKKSVCITYSEHAENRVLYRRKDCCYHIEKGGVLKYMSILIKISNHLALILPGIVDGSVACYHINAHIRKPQTIARNKCAWKFLLIFLVH